MSSNMDMNEVNSHLDEIIAMYTDETYLHRLKKLFSGLKAPRQSREYKSAMIEMQRLSAPLAAILLPVLGVGLLLLMDGGGTGADRVIETQVLEAEQLKELEKIEELEKPEEQIEETNIDMPVNNPDVKVQSDTPDQPMSPQPQAFDAVMTVKSPVILKNIYGSTRNTGTRGASLARFGGDKMTEDAVMRALRWLKKNQQADGSWSKNKVAMTSLAVLTFLAHGEKPGDSPEFGATIQKALEYLIGTQNKTTGRIPGNYEHPIATYALCEAYGMTLNPNVKTAAEKALVPIIKGQHPTGGWTYNMNPDVEKAGTEKEPNALAGKYRDDTSYMGWCAQALKAAKLAKLHAEGLEKASKLAIKGFKKNANPNGGFGYTGPGQGGLTSVGTLCMQLLGASNDSEVKKSLDLMDNWVPSFEAKGPQGGSLQYYFYYATQCKFHAGGKRWENWNKEMKPIYIKAQKIEKNAIKDDKGKDCDIGWWENGDAHTDRPVMDTTLAALQLMVYYRYLPTTSKEAVQVEEEIVATSTDTEDIKVDTGNL
jgi:hypothetical protein